MIRATAVTALAVMCLSPGSAALQQGTFRSSALAVRADVLVTDGSRPVGGLQASDFELRDNGILQTVSLVEASDVPLNVVLALDISASVAGERLESLVDAAKAALEGLTANDRAALTTFSHAVSQRVEPTSNLDEVRHALSQLQPGGRTAVMDGLFVALASTLAQPGRSLVIVYTDGADISSWLRPDDVVDSARRSNAVVYAVASSKARFIDALQSVTSATGGEVLEAEGQGELRASFQKILRDFRSRYILAYTPRGVEAGGLHKLDVRVKRRGLSVKARPSYIGVRPNQ